MAAISDTLNHGVPCEAATRRQVIETVVVLTTLQENCGPAAVADSAYFGDHRPMSTTFGADPPDAPAPGGAPNGRDRPNRGPDHDDRHPLVTAPRM